MYVFIYRFWNEGKIAMDRGVPVADRARRRRTDVQYRPGVFTRYCSWIATLIRSGGSVRTNEQI